MTGEPSDRVGLEDIKAPTPEPALLPDKHTKKALREALPSAGHRLEAMTKLHVADVTAQRDSYKQKYFDVQAKLSKIEPEAIRLRQLVGATLVWSVMSTIAIAIGSTLVSSAGYTKTYHESALWGGWAVLGCGLISLIVNQIYAGIRKDG